MEDKKKAVMNGELTEQDVAETNAKLDSEKLDGVSGGIALCAEDKSQDHSYNSIENYRHIVDDTESGEVLRLTLTDNETERRI